MKFAVQVLSQKFLCKSLPPDSLWLSQCYKQDTCAKNPGNTSFYLNTQDSLFLHIHLLSLALCLRLYRAIPDSSGARGLFLQQLIQQYPNPFLSPPDTSIMQVINTSTNRLHLASFLLMFVSHLCHLVGSFVFTSFLQIPGCQQAQIQILTQQDHRSSLQRSCCPRSPRYITAPSRPSLCYLTQPSPLVSQCNRNYGNK